MDQNDDRLPAIVEYLKMHPTPPAESEGQQVIHYHVHNHHAPPPAPPPPPRATVAEQVVPWIWLGLAALIIGTVCAMILAAVIVALVVGMLAAAVVAAVLAYLIKTMRESQINADLTRSVTGQTRRRR